MAKELDKRDPDKPIACSDSSQERAIQCIVRIPTLIILLLDPSIEVFQRAPNKFKIFNHYNAPQIAIKIPVNFPSLRAVFRFSQRLQFGTSPSTFVEFRRNSQGKDYRIVLR